MIESHFALTGNFNQGIKRNNCFRRIIVSIFTGPIVSPISQTFRMGAVKNIFHKEFLIVVPEVQTF